MFGFLRFYLAWMVVVTHITNIIDYVGGFAVYSFYILSGYLMTYIMNKKYGYNPTGMKRYLLNRFLRIFPPYWIVGLVTIFGIVLVPTVFFDMHESLRFPETVHEFVSNIAIFGLFSGVPKGAEVEMARLVPAAWALHVELCFYCLIGLFLGRYKVLVSLWLLLSVLYHILAVKYAWPRYSPVYAASLPFSLGAFLYHNKRLIGRLIPDYSGLAVVSLLLFIMFTLTARKIPMTTTVCPFYLNMAFTFILIYQLSNIDRQRPSLVKKIDSFLGDLSYPIYLSHWLVATVVGAVFDLKQSPLLFIVLIPFLMIFSIIMKYAIGDPIERKRRSIAESLHDRANKTLRPTTGSSSSQLEGQNNTTTD